MDPDRDRRDPAGPGRGVLRAARLPESTYRLQLHAGFTFRDATAIAPIPARPGDHPRVRLAVPEGPAREHPRLRHHRPQLPQPRDRHRRRLRGVGRRAAGRRDGPDPRHRPQSHGGRHQRERLVERRAGERRRRRDTGRTSTSPGAPRPGRSSRTRSCCRSWATPMATCSSPGSSGSPSPTGRSRPLLRPPLPAGTAGATTPSSAIGSTSWRGPRPRGPRADRIPEHPDRQSATSPWPHETEPGRVAERQREKEVIKRRLATLAAESEPVRRFIEENVEAVQRPAPATPTASTCSTS